MGVLRALAGLGTALGVGGALVLGLNSHAAPAKETEYTIIPCEVVTSLLKKERPGPELEGEAGDGGRCLLQSSGAETQRGGNPGEEPSSRRREWVWPVHRTARRPLCLERSDGGGGIVATAKPA